MFSWPHGDIPCDSSQASSLTTVKNTDVQIDYDGLLCGLQVTGGAAFGENVSLAWPLRYLDADEQGDARSDAGETYSDIDDLGEAGAG